MDADIRASPRPSMDHCFLVQTNAISHGVARSVDGVCELLCHVRCLRLAGRIPGAPRPDEKAGLKRSRRKSR